MKDIRLIAMDMDGTLLNSRQELSPGNAAALRAAQEAGVKLAISSGRGPGDNALFAQTHGFPQWAILSLNGAYCLETPTSPPYVNHLLKQESAVVAVRWLEESGMTFGCFLQNQIAVFQGDHYDDSFFWSSDWGDQPGAPVYLKGRDAFDRAFQKGMNKIVCLEENAQKLRSMWQRLESLPGLEITTSWPSNLEVMPKGVSKGGAVKELAEKMGISPEQVMTLGDYDNDLSMIEYAGYGVAMANATANVKKAAKFETLDNDQDGVAAAIRRFAL